MLCRDIVLYFPKKDNRQSWFKDQVLKKKLPCTCWRTCASGASDWFESGIQVKYELIEIFQGHVKVMVNKVKLWLRDTRWMRDISLWRVNADGLTHSQNMAGYQFGHAFSCRHHNGGNHCLLKLQKAQEEKYNYNWFHFVCLMWYHAF